MKTKAKVKTKTVRTTKRSAMKHTKAAAKPKSGGGPVLKRKPKSKKSGSITLPGMEKPIRPGAGIHLPGMEGKAKLTKHQLLKRYGNN